MESSPKYLRLIKLIKSVPHKTILIHQDQYINLKEIIQKEIKENIFITTSDLRFTKKNNPKINAEIDLVIYQIHSYDSREKIKQNINNYVTDHNIIIIGKRKKIKNLSKSIKIKTQFYSEENLIALISKQKNIYIENKIVCFNVEIKQIKLRFKTKKGLFSYKNVDLGTKFLLENVDINSKDKLLDFACGYGPIGIFFAKKYPLSSILMTDSNLESLEFTKKNIEINKIDNTTVKPAYFMKGINEKFDKIISNPPTHAKLTEIDELIKTFKNSLRKDGVVYIIINNIVNYERLAKKYFKSVITFAKNRQYKIIKFSN